VTTTGDGESPPAEGVECGQKSPAENVPVENEVTVCTDATPPIAEAQEVTADTLQVATPPVAKSQSEDSLPGSMPKELTENQPVEKLLETEQQESHFRDTLPAPVSGPPEQPTDDPSRAVTPPASNTPDEPVGEEVSHSISAEPEGIGTEPVEGGVAKGSDSNLPQDSHSGTPDSRSEVPCKFAHSILRVRVLRS